jgi:hypothetical protein
VTLNVTNTTSRWTPKPARRHRCKYRSSDDWTEYGRRVTSIVALWSTSADQGGALESIRSAYRQRPRHHLLAWILVDKLAPTYYNKLDTTFAEIGRFRELPSWRRDFKQTWKKAEKTPFTGSLNQTLPRSSQIPSSSSPPLPLVYSEITLQALLLLTSPAMKLFWNPERTI